MLTQIASVKLRLEIAEADTSYDSIIGSGIEWISARCEHDCNRQFARAVGAVHEFAADEREIVPPCYPIESVASFAVKESESAGWVVQTGLEPLIRSGCVVSLPLVLGYSWMRARMTYTGGYVLPGATLVPGAAVLPKDLEKAVIEQVAFWFQSRKLLGVLKSWPATGEYVQYEDVDLLPGVREVWGRYKRWGS